MSGGKFRHRVHNKNKVRVPKGMTCESNPTKNRHRAAAAATRQLTYNSLSDMVAVDDRIPETATDQLMDDIGTMNLGTGQSNKSMISEGGLSRISQFTSCTNPAFDAVHRVWKSGSSMQTEVISVLAAVAELIKERNGTLLPLLHRPYHDVTNMLRRAKGTESDVEYFAALLTALEGAPLGSSSRTAATAYLLHMIVKKVNKEVLQSQFTRTVQVLYTKLLENTENSDGSILKNLLSVLGVVLRAQPTAVWNSANTRNVVVSIAALCTHDKPWVRTMARRVVRAVLTDPVRALDDGLHPASAPVARFVLEQLDGVLGQKNGSLLAVRYFCLLEGIMHKMPDNLFKQLSETILKSFSVTDSMVKCSALQCLHRTLQRQPCDAALPAETNALIVVALRQLAPPAHDMTVCAYWMQALAEAHVCLAAKDPERSNQLLPATLTPMVKLFETASESHAQIVYQVLSRLMEHCIQDNEELARQLLSQLDDALNLQSTAVWKFILRCEMRLYETAKEGIVGPEFEKALTSLAQLRQSDQCFCKAELDFTIGAAVRHVGVGAVLDVLPLDIAADAPVLAMDFPRSWLIPVLRVNIHNAPLALFTSKFLPLTMKIHTRLPTLDPLPQRLYQTLQSQLWELLVSFCESPCDVDVAFPELAPILGAALNERKDLRLTVCSALRRLLKFVMQPDAPADKVDVMSRYAKNFMPILFNMYTNSTVEGEYDDKGVRLAVLETVRAYAPATPEDLLTRFVVSAIQKSQEEGPSPAAAAKQLRILDILAVLVRHCDLTSVGKVLEVVYPWFTTTSSVGLQKKAFRILEEMLLRRTRQGEMDSFVESHRDEIDEAITMPLQAVQPPARPALMSCVKLLLELHEDLEAVVEFSKTVLVSVILTLDKSNSTHARANASSCLQAICEKLIKLTPSEEPTTGMLSPVMTQVFELANQGETGQVELGVSRATLVALNIIAQKRLKELSGAQLSQIINHGCSWVEDGRAPVRILVIRLLRVLVTKMPDVALHQYKDLILPAVFQSQLTADLTVKVRKANRLLLEVLVEKFGTEVLEKQTQKPEWLKQMRNIAKLRRRKAAKEAGKAPDAEDMDDEMSAVSSRHSARTAGADTILELLEDSEHEDSDAEMETRSRGGRSLWLREDAHGDATDLLDTADMIHKVTTTDPSLLARKKARQLEKKQSNKDGGFQFTKDGKLIIANDDDEKPRTSGRKTKDGLNELDSDSESETRGGKRQKKDSDAETDEDGDEIFAKTMVSRASGKASMVSGVSGATGYKHGGQGIHRDTRKRKGPVERPQKKQQKGVQPYAYIELRKGAGKPKDVRQILKAQRKSGKGKAGRSK